MANQGIFGPTTSNTLVTPSLLALAEPEAREVDGAAMDYLVMEAVTALRQSSSVATARMKEKEREMIEAGLLPPLPPQPSIPLGIKKDSVRDSISSARTVKLSDDEEEALRMRLENMGAVVGSSLAERLSKDRPRFSDTLDIIKFLCKDIWAAVWDKQVDNLRTNHRGVYVLQDNAFKPLLRLSTPSGPQDALKRGRIYLAFPVGILRGALARLGLQATIVPETTALPQCTFQIKLPKGS